MNHNADISKIVVDGKEYVPVDSVREHEGDIKIVVLQRGWVLVGRFERIGSDCKLHNAYVIRNWGTSNGLGELANKGKLPDTVLDKTHGVVEFDYLTVVLIMACREDVWEKEL